ncbi:MAG: DUF3604 domain-containing protein [Pseudomonadota bacterium]
MKWTSIAHASALFASTSLAADLGRSNAGVLKGPYPGKSYAPCVKRPFPSQVYRGETHLHTGLSMDARMFGNAVDLGAANWTNTIGALEIAAVCTDPAEHAFYYARRIEIATPRRVTYDKVYLGTELPPESELIGQERA